jgi:hypothetical protein
MPHPAQLLEMPFGQASATEFTDEAACGEFLARLPDAPSRFGRLGDDEPFRIRLKNVPLPGVSLLAGVQTPKATGHWSRRADRGGIHVWCVSAARHRGGGPAPDGGRHGGARRAQADAARHPDVSFRRPSGSRHELAARDPRPLPGRRCLRLRRGGACGRRPRRRRAPHGRDDAPPRPVLRSAMDGANHPRVRYSSRFGELPSETLSRAGR